jgi:hypothetical protein
MKIEIEGQEITLKPQVMPSQEVRWLHSSEEMG